MAEMAGCYGLGIFPELKQELRSYRQGILPYQDIKRLVESEHICATEAIQEAQVQPASVDLRLGDIALQVRASFLPGTRTRVRDAFSDLIVQEIDIQGGAVLQKGAVYIIPLLESLRLPANTLANANPK